MQYGSNKVVLVEVRTFSEGTPCSQIKLSLLFWCVFECVSAHDCTEQLFSEGMLRAEKLGLGRMGVFNISKVSSRDIQRHKRVTGDADSSVNSAGGWAQDVITRCSRWQQRWSWAVPNVLYLPNNTAGCRGLGVMRKNPPSQTEKKRHRHAPYTLYAMWPVKGQRTKRN